MKFSEFYEKYWVVANADGTTTPCKLPDEEKAIYDKAEELGVEPFIVHKHTRGRMCTEIFVNPVVEEALKLK